MYKARRAPREEAPRTVSSKGIIIKKKKFDPPQFQWESNLFKNTIKYNTAIIQINKNNSIKTP